MKRFFALILIISILLPVLPSANALDMTMDNELIVVQDSEKNNRINELFSMRNGLEVDFETNGDAIAAIDNELVRLGVEMIPYTEVMTKLGYDALPAANVSSTSSTQWTSRRTVVTYRGQQYELQIIEGIPIDGAEPASPLIRNDAEVSYEEAGIVAGITEAVKVLGVEALGDAPEVGDALSVACTAYSMLKAYWSALTTSTVISEVRGTALLTMATHMKYIFVKGYGSSDAYQILCYIGNSVSYFYTTVTPIDIPGDGTATPVHATYTSETDVARSKYYDDYSAATYNYYAARNHLISEMTFIYSVTYINIRVFGDDNRFRVPTEDAPLA